MGAIQNSINQLITTTAIGAYASRQSIRADREREMARTEQIHRETPAAVGEDGEGNRPFTPQELEAHRFKEYKGGKGIIGDLKDIKAEQKLQGERVSVSGPGYEDLAQEASDTELFNQKVIERIKNRAAQKQKAEEFRQKVKSEQFADLVKNPNTKAADVEKWRKQ